MSLREALTSPQFGVLALTYFLCCATHSGPLFHTVSYAISCGLSVTAAVSIYSVEGLAGLGGRIVFGLLGDRFGAKRTFVSGLFLQAAAVGCYMLVRQQFAFYSVAVVFGFAYAGIMPLYSVLIRENFPLPIIGSVVGAASMASSMGMALGPLAGGLIFDTYGTYRWPMWPPSCSGSVRRRSCSRSGRRGRRGRARRVRNSIPSRRSDSGRHSHGAPPQKLTSLASLQSSPSPDQVARGGWR